MRALLLLVGVAFVSTACVGTPPPRAAGQPVVPFVTSPSPDAAPPPAPRTAPPTPIPDAVLVGAGDIASCVSDGDEATAAVLDAIEGTVFTAGDNAYESGSEQEFRDCYGPSWGRHKKRTRPALGNHDYGSPGAEPHFAYFGLAAGEVGKGYYSFGLGAWHVVVLNSNCARVRCLQGSEQERWLREDLAKTQPRCVLAVWHHPRWSSGQHGSDITYHAFWQALYDAGADVVVNGHDHNYERFAPQDPRGRHDPERGIRQFIVGTGGASLRAVRTPVANSEVLRNDTFGVLRLALASDGYEWAFVAVGGKVSDSGSGACR